MSKTISDEELKFVIGRKWVERETGHTYTIVSLLWNSTFLMEHDAVHEGRTVGRSELLEKYKFIDAVDDKYRFFNYQIDHATVTRLGDKPLSVVAEYYDGDDLARATYMECDLRTGEHYLRTFNWALPVTTVVESEGRDFPFEVRAAIYEHTRDIVDMLREGGTVMWVGPDDNDFYSSNGRVELYDEHVYTLELLRGARTLRFDPAYLGIRDV